MNDDAPTGSGPQGEWAEPVADDRVVDVAGSGGESTGSDGSGSGGSALGGWLGRPVVWVVGLVVVALVVGGVVVLGGGSAGAGEVILEPAAADGSDPFFESIATSSVEVPGGGVAAVAGDPDGVETVDGSTPGLYGGTGEDAVCDAGALVGFLEKNPAKAKAFAGVLGIRPSGIADYVAGLTPVVLREDTRVTNHGFSGGEATARQSVLQAGTAVLVDARGVPRVRCACGNPLIEPTATASAPTFEGDGWAGFDDTRLVAVEPGTAVDSFEVVDVTTDEAYTQPVGSNTGQIVLAADGLGVATFGQPRAEVVAAITAILGEPDEVNEEVIAGGFVSFYEWGHLMAAFLEGAPYVEGEESTRNAGEFGEYFFGRTYDFQSDTYEPWLPEPWEEALTTEKGVGIGTTGAEVATAYPTTYRITFQQADPGVDFDYCETETPTEGVGERQPGVHEQFYAKRGKEGLYFSPLIDGCLLYTSPSPRDRS